MILIDFEKAFDTNSNEIVLKELSVNGFSDRIVKWFQSYLPNRKFTRKFREFNCRSFKTLCGVPQRSILGPLLFLIYFNDMPVAVKCNLFLYGDDKCLVFQSKNVIEDIEKQLNVNFANI